MSRLVWMSHAHTQGDAGVALWLFFLQEFVDDLFYVAMLAVYGVVQLTHIIVGYFSGEFIEGLFYFWMCG